MKVGVVLELLFPKMTPKGFQVPTQVKVRVDTTSNAREATQHDYITLNRVVRL